MVRRGMSLGLFATLLAGGGLLRAEVPQGAYTFQVFPSPRSTSFALASFLEEDGEGGLWFIQGGGLVRFDGHAFHRVEEPEGRPAQALVSGKGGALWILFGDRWVYRGQGELVPVPGLVLGEKAEGVVGFRGLGLGVIQEGMLTLWEEPGAPSVRVEAPPEGEWTSGCRDPKNGDILLVGRLGMARWQGKQWTVRDLRGVVQGVAYEVYRDRRGHTWIRTEQDLLRLGPDGSSRRFGRELGLRRGFQLSLKEDAQGRIWTERPDGLAWVDGDRAGHIGREEGLPGVNPNWPFCIDRQGRLWVLTDAGLLRLRGGLAWSTQGRDQGFPPLLTYCLVRDPVEGILVGTQDGVYTRRTGRWSLLPGTAGWSVRTAVRDARGRLWVGGWPSRPEDPPLLCIEPGGRSHGVPLPGVTPGAGVVDLLVAGDGSLYVATEAGLGRLLLGDRFEKVDLPPMAGDPEVRWIRESPSGMLWLGKAGGVLLRREGAWKVFGKAQGLVEDGTLGAFFTPGGDLWVLHGRQEGGLTRLGLEGREWGVRETLGKGHPLLAEGLVGAALDGGGRLWVAGTGSLRRLDGSDVTVFTRASGLPSESFGLNTLLPCPDGSIWVGTTAGLAVFDPRFDRARPPFPTIRLGQALDRKGGVFPEGALLPHGRGGLTLPVRLAPGDGVEDARLQARLVGLEEAWEDVDGEAIHHPHLGAGAYRLEVRVLLPDGRTGPVRAFAFGVRPPWYLRAWFLAVASLAGLGALAGVLRWRTWALARDKARLEAEVGSRTEDLLKANADLVDVLAEMKTLRGFIPICSYCKKIRNDAGYWNQLEHYLHEHTGAQLSHGICPECRDAVRREMGLEPRKGEEGPGS